MRKLFALAALIALCVAFVSPADAQTKFRAFTALNGGGTGAIDKIPIAELTNGDIAFTVTTTYFYVHRFDSSATNAESSPTYIRPDDYATAGVWTLQGLFGSTLQGGPSATPSIVLRDSDATDGDDNFKLYINCTDTGSGTEDCDAFIQVQIAGTLTTIMQIDADGSVIWTHPMTFGAGGTLTLPTTTSGDQTLTAGMIGIKTDEDAIVIHGGAAGEVQDEAVISLIQHVSIVLDPSWAYDQSATYRTFPITYLGDDFPHGLTLVEWRLRYVDGNPTTELDADLMCDTTPDFNPAAGATVMDALDTTDGASGADSGFDSATCANGSNLYIRFGADPTDANVLILLDLWFFANED